MVAVWTCEIRPTRRAVMGKMRPMVSAVDIGCREATLVAQHANRGVTQQRASKDKEDS